MDARRRFVDRLPDFEKPALQTPIRLVCFDMDGVLIREGSSWVAVHEHFGIREGLGLEPFLRGEIDDEEFVRRDVGMWLERKPEMTTSDVNAILDSLTLVKGAARACEILREAGCQTCIVSGGLDYAAERVAQELGIEHVSANGLHAHADGRLTGTGYVNTPLRDKSGPVRRFAEKFGVPLGATASVGNSSPDIPMFRATGLGIAFRAIDPFVVEHADVEVKGQDLTDVARRIVGAS